MKQITSELKLALCIAGLCIAGLWHGHKIKENTKRIDRLEALPYITLSDMRQAVLFTNALSYNTNNWKHNTP